MHFLPNYILPEGFNGNRERLIEHYFNLGLSYAEILCFLVAVHGIHISLRQLKRILKQLGLRRRGNLDSINKVITNVESELPGSGRSAGYRAIQRFLRRDCEDAFSGLKRFVYGKSVSNQRIEAWWSTLRRSNSDWWMNFFKDMRDMGLYNDGDPLRVQCLRYCFMNVLRNELHQVAKLWNLHRIRPSVNSDSPPGRPDLLYFLPQATDTINYATVVDEDDLDVCEYLADVTNASNSADLAFAELAQIIMDEQNLRMPESAEEARRLYIDLMHDIEALR